MIKIESRNFHRLEASECSLNRVVVGVDSHFFYSSSLTFFPVLDFLSKEILAERERPQKSKEKALHVNIALHKNRTVIRAAIFSLKASQLPFR